MKLFLWMKSEQKLARNLGMVASHVLLTSLAPFRTSIRKLYYQSWRHGPSVLQVGWVILWFWGKEYLFFLLTLSIDCGRCSNVQATSMSAHRHDWKHMRVLFSFRTLNLHTLILDSFRYCPGGPDSDFDYSTQSYTGYEPTSMRAIRARYDPYEQTRGRVEQLKSLGHSVDKVCFVPFYPFTVDDYLWRSNS